MYVEKSLMHFACAYRLGLGKSRIAGAVEPDLPFYVFELCKKVLEFVVNCRQLLLGMSSVEQLYVTVRFCCDQFLQRVLAFQQSGIATLTNVGVGCGQHLQQSPGSGAFRDLKSRLRLFLL